MAGEGFEVEWEPALALVCDAMPEHSGEPVIQSVAETPPAPTSPWRLVADIGGTHARFAVADNSGELACVQTLACDDFAGLDAAVRAYLAGVGVGQVNAAAFAMATPIVGDTVSLTNRSVWSFSASELARSLAISELRVINDFTAQALALPWLKASDVVAIGGGDTPVDTAPRAVIGPGTGLGISALIPTAGGWHALATEGGHVSFCALDAHELELQRVLARRFAHISAERVLSGPGLVNLYRAHCELSGQAAEELGPSDITERGLAGSCPICRAVLDDFCAILGTVAGNLVLTLGARAGVYIGGGIAPRLLSMLEASAFRSRFEAHGRLSAYLAAVPSYVITAKYPALLGALAALEQDQQQAIRKLRGTMRWEGDLDEMRDAT
jgi:glucokinase